MGFKPLNKNNSKQNNKEYRTNKIPLHEYMDLYYHFRTLSSSYIEILKANLNDFLSAAFIQSW